ncbi:MAG: hypothetical protein WAV13_02110 [Thermodesulfovibrionales bacterium]
MKKLNCWEFKKCGRQPGGEHVKDMGLCPATVEERLNGVHEGSNGGRACWVIAGTLCKGEKQGTFAQKLTNCVTCDFYKQVKDEEFPSFKLSAVILAKLSD